MFVTCSSRRATAKLTLIFKQLSLYWVSNSSNCNFNSPEFGAVGDNDVKWAITVEPHGSIEDGDENRFSVLLRLAKNNQSEVTTGPKRNLLAKFHLSIIDKSSKQVIATVQADDYRGYRICSEGGKRIWITLTEAEILALPAVTISK